MAFSSSLVATLSLALTSLGQAPSPSLLVGDYQHAPLASYNTPPRSKKRQNVVTVVSATDKVESVNALMAMQATRAHNRLYTFKKKRKNWKRTCVSFE